LTNFARRVLLAVEKRARPALSRPEAWQRAAVVAVNAILVVALAHSLAVLTLAVVSGRSLQTVGMIASEPAANGATVTRSPAEYAAIGSWHLFGRVEDNRPVEATPAPIPVTQLNLRLVGVFFMERGSNRALALIAEGNGPERGYRIGEPLPGGARLEQIQRDHVVVSRNGRQEVLNLPKLGSAGRPAPAMPVTPMPAAMPVTPMPADIPDAPVPAQPEPEPATTGFSGQQVIDASTIAGRLRSEVTTRPQALEDIAFASPYVQNGQFTGFRLRPGRDRQLFGQLGLNGGDVITEINGVRLNNPAQGLTMLQELMNASRVDVRVLRNGAEIPLTFSLDGPSPNEQD
jgi:general secretion pathway protein C